MRTKARVISALFLLLQAAPWLHAQEDAVGTMRRLNAERAEALLRVYDTVRSADWYACAVQYSRNRADDRTSANARALVSRTGGDVFWMLAATALSVHARGALPPDVDSALDECWRTYVPFRGDTENHWAAYYAALFLAAERRAGLAGDAWFNGRSSDENFRDARAYLLQWMRRAGSEGLREFDSPIYLTVFVSALVLLHDAARDEEVRLAATMTLDVLLAEFALAQLDGMPAGAHSRATASTLLFPRRAPANGLAWLYFGAPGADRTQTDVLCALSSYRPPDAVLRMAAAPKTPEHIRRSARPRETLRYATGSADRVRITLTRCADFALGSLRGGEVSPIQQHSWGLVFASDDPSPVVFGLHPHWSERGLGMFFPEDTKTLLSQVAAAKPSLIDPGKWEGGSPYERAYQDGPVLFVLYDIPRDAPVRDAFVHVPGTLDTLVREAGGWILFHEGRTAGGVYVCSRTEWEEQEGRWRVRVRGPVTGLVLDIRQLADGEDAAGVFEDLRSRMPLLYRGSEGPELSYTAPHGRFRASFTEGLQREGKSADPEPWPRLESTHARQGNAPGIILLRDGTHVLEYDFTRFIVRRR